MVEARYNSAAQHSALFLFTEKSEFEAPVEAQVICQLIARLEGTPQPEGTGRSRHERADARDAHPMNQSNDDILHSWKEIAEWLRCDVRTAMRWEKERSLPVHRVPGAKRGAVFAYRSELGTWLREGKAAESRALESTSPVDGSARSRITRRTLALAVAVAAVLTLGGAYTLIFDRDPAVERATFSGNRLQAWDAKGQLIWEHDFGEPVNEPSSFLTKRIHILDINGDGKNEIVAAPPFRQQDSLRDELFCFSSRGDLLWRYNPDQVLRIGGKEFKGPWHFKELMILAAGSSKVFWLAVSHHTWFPDLDCQGGCPRPCRAAVCELRNHPAAGEFPYS